MCATVQCAAQIDGLWGCKDGCAERKRGPNTCHRGAAYAKPHETIWKLLFLPQQQVVPPHAGHCSQPLPGGKTQYSTVQYSAHSHLQHCVGDAAPSSCVQVPAGHLFIVSSEVQRPVGSSVLKLRAERGTPPGHQNFCRVQHGLVRHHQGCVSC